MQPGAEVGWQPGVRLLPMTNDRVETHVAIPDPESPSGSRVVHFQEYWVRLHAEVPAETVVVVAAWNAYNALLLNAALTVAWERPQRRRHHRLDRRLPVRVRVEREARIDVRPAWDVGVGAAARSTPRDRGYVPAGVPPGEHELYISVVNFLLVTKKVSVPAGAGADVTIALTQGTGTYSESVSVVGAAAGRSSAAPVESEVHGIERVPDGRCLIIANHSGQPVDKVVADCDRDHWLTAFEARDYGLIDEVLVTNPKKSKKD